MSEEAGGVAGWTWGQALTSFSFHVDHGVATFSVVVPGRKERPYRTGAGCAPGE